MASLTEADRSFLQRPLNAWITVVRPDGSLHSTVVWLEVAGDEVLFSTLSDRSKGRHLEHNPQACIAVLDPDDPFHWISNSGTARIETEGVAETIGRLYARYMPGAAPPQLEPTRILVRVTPDHVLRQGS